jgi:hypothetical protein
MLDTVLQRTLWLSDGPMGKSQQVYGQEIKVTISLVPTLQSDVARTVHPDIL